MAIPQIIRLGCNQSNSRDDEYVEPFYPEKIIVEVEGDSIVYFAWCNMYDIDIKLNENIALKPFDEIVGNAENQFAVKYAYMEDEGENYDLYIDRIVLTYAVQSIKDKKYEYMLVPAWTFYGGFDYKDGYEREDGKVLEGRHKEPCSLLTVNAVDGTLIQGN